MTSCPRPGAEASLMPALATPPPPPAHVQVFAAEYRLSASRVRVPRGRLVVQVKNIGEDDHDLAVRAADGTLRAALASWGSQCESRFG